MNKIYDNCVVGSGPAAIAYMISRKKYCSNLDNLVWVSDDKTINDSQHFQDNGKLSPKYNNKDFRYSNDRFLKLYNIKCKNVKIVSSLRHGGNGSIWGGYLAKFNQKEFDLPLKHYNELKTAYEEIYDYFKFPEYIDVKSSNTKNVDFIIKKNILNLINNKKISNNFFINYPNLAINLSDVNRPKYNYEQTSITNKDNPGIFNTEFEYKKLLEDKSIKSKSNFHLKEIFHDGNFFVLTLINSKNNNLEKIRCLKLTLAAGAIGSPILVSRFLRRNVVLRIKHNPAFFFPFFNFNKSLFNFKEKFVRLCNAEFLIIDKKFKEIFGNIFSCSIIDNDTIKSKFFFLKFFPNFVIEIFKNQLNLCTIYFDGRYSNTFMKIEKNKVNIISKMSIFNVSNISFIKKIIKKHFKTFFPFLCYEIENGTDAHYGCTIPFSQNKKEFTTNEYGQLNNFNYNLKIIDGSILKNLPSKPLTLTIMANAYRIGKNEYTKT